MTNVTSKPAPLETGRGEQKDDNIDDLGNRPDGSEEDQPVDGARDERTDAGDKPRPRAQ